MSHFSKQAIESDPDGLARLKEILHGRSLKARTGRAAEVSPTRKERFGVDHDGRDGSVRPLRLVPAGPNRR